MIDHGIKFHPHPNAIGKTVMVWQVMILGILEHFYLDTIDIIET